MLNWIVDFFKEIQGFLELIPFFAQSLVNTIVTFFKAFSIFKSIMGGTGSGVTLFQYYVPDDFFQIWAPVVSLLLGLSMFHALKKVFSL